jgi:hypothetical protein
VHFVHILDSWGLPVIWRTFALYVHSHIGSIRELRRLGPVACGCGIPSLAVEPTKPRNRGKPTAKPSKPVDPPGSPPDLPDPP